MEDRKQRVIKETYLKRLAEKVLQLVEIIDTMVTEDIRNQQWFINWQDHLNEISVK